jgi:hypothetical protein
MKAPARPNFWKNTIRSFSAETLSFEFKPLLKEFKPALENK